ncbi:MAG: YdcF family protein, partial [Sphingobacterium sp.]
MRKFILSVFLSFSSLFTVLCHGKTIMLVLGSADPNVLQERVHNALRLYQVQPFNDIIVSGGCGAHGSSICEATSMFDQMRAGGIPADKIHKEENAKTTVQNYIFSRNLENDYGEKIIQKGDTVFVVSNHWHAIAVAARLEKYDGVVGRFYIEGSLQPKATDKLDYVDIFNGEPDNDKFIAKGSWLTPDAVWRDKDSIYYLMNNLLYTTNKDNTHYSTKKLDRSQNIFKGLNLAQDLHFIDDDKQWLVWNGKEFQQIDKGTGKVKKKFAWDTFLKNAPESWKHSLNTGFIKGESLYLFSDSKVLVAKKNGKNYEFETEDATPKYFHNWPYAWGKGYV